MVSEKSGAAQRLVLQPATGEALCSACLGLQAKPRPLPKPTERSTRRGGFGVVSVTIPKKKPAPVVREPIFRGAELLALKEDIDRRYELTRNLKYIAAQLEKPYTLVRYLYLTGDLAPELRDMIRDYNLTVNMGFSIQQYPEALRVPLAKAFGSLPRTPAFLWRAIYRASHVGMHVLRERLEREGFVWPEDLNDDGTPKT